MATDYSLHDWLFDKEFSVESRSIFYGMFAQPFIKEDNEYAEERFIEASYFFEDAQNNIPKQECLGLASAYLSETLSVSIQSNPAWLNNALKIEINKNGVVTNGDVNHCFSKNCFNAISIKKFVDTIGVLWLIETPLSREEKKIHLTTHHGKKELRELWDKLKQSPYIIEGISIEWGGNSFYKNCTEDGKVDIVLLKSDRKYALQIQTTGRTLRETKAIAEILQEQYS